MAEIAESSESSPGPSGPKLEQREEFDPETMRRTKPGAKRLVLTFSVLVSFLIGTSSLARSKLTSVRPPKRPLFLQSQPSRDISLSEFLLVPQVFLSCGNRSKSTARRFCSTTSMRSPGGRNRSLCSSRVTFARCS